MRMCRQCSLGDGSRRREGWSGNCSTAWQCLQGAILDLHRKVVKAGEERSFSSGVAHPFSIHGTGHKRCSVHTLILPDWFWVVGRRLSCVNLMQRSYLTQQSIYACNNR
ncbi:hypothetical protein INR49_006249 [Caranx melampygus]|nr:hypothetical protein INR49_006249 [Caranx melampygus]